MYSAHVSILFPWLPAAPIPASFYGTPCIHGATPPCLNLLQTASPQQVLLALLEPPAHTLSVPPSPDLPQPLQTPRAPRALNGLQAPGARGRYARDPEPMWKRFLRAETHGRLTNKGDAQPTGGWHPWVGLQAEEDAERAGSGPDKVRPHDGIRAGTCGLLYHPPVKLRT